MYNIYLLGSVPEAQLKAFSSKYEITDDISQANVILTDGTPVTGGMLESRLVFAAAGSLDEGSVSVCSERGTAVFKDASDIPDYIENGNIHGSVNFPDADLGPFSDEESRVSVLTGGIDAPVLLGAMMFSELDIKAVAGGLTENGLGCALVLLREPVSGVPHVDGVLKVRVLQDI